MSLSNDQKALSSGARSISQRDWPEYKTCKYTTEAIVTEGTQSRMHKPPRPQAEVRDEIVGSTEAGPVLFAGARLPDL